MAAAVGGGIASFLFGGWDSALTALAVFMGIDYLTGFLAAGKAGKLNSNVGLWGIAKKAGVFAVVAVVHQLDLHLLEGQADVFRDGAIFFFLANEALSILETAAGWECRSRRGFDGQWKNFKGKERRRSEDQSASDSEE